MAKLDISKIRKARSKVLLQAQTFRLHRDVVKAYKKQAEAEGCGNVHLVEKAIVYYVNMMERANGSFLEKKINENRNRP